MAWPVSIVGYRELHNHTFQTSWDAMVWYFYDQFYSSRACYQGGPGPRFRPRKSRTDPDQVQHPAAAPVTGSGARVSVTPGLNMPRIPGSGRTQTRTRQAVKAAPAFARVKQSDWGLSVGSRGPSQAATGPWLQSYLSPAQSRGARASSESQVWHERDTGTRGLVRLGCR